ncbi:MAG: prephenate dehydrogenase/arogenate dehydrogenase family protein [Pirellulaceae bacterium]
MTQPNEIQRIAILGVGLLGGSVALSLRRRLPNIEIIGFSRSEAKRQRTIELGVIDSAADSVPAACDGCDVVVVAAPVDRIAEMATIAAASAPKNCLITDVGSTKETIVAAVSLPNFVAAHPIAGSEKTGAENAKADLFDGKVIVITPSEKTDPMSLRQCDDFWRLTGGRTVQLSPAAHDAYLAAVSHVPHLMSSIIARLMPPAARELVGSGWRDMTRVASGDPTLWTAICRENRNMILDQLDLLSTDVARLREMLVDADEEGLQGWLAEAQTIKSQTIKQSAQE